MKRFWETVSNSIARFFACDKVYVNPDSVSRFSNYRR